MLDHTTCPDCGAVARVVWRAVLESTDGPIEHAKVRCAQAHWFLLPVADLPRAREGFGAVSALAVSRSPGEGSGARA